LYGAFVWARRALNGPKRRFPAPRRARYADGGAGILGHGASHTGLGQYMGGGVQLEFQGPAGGHALRVHRVRERHGP
jgi:hypothetical protein